MKWWTKESVEAEQAKESFLVNTINRLNVRLTHLEDRVKLLEDRLHDDGR